MKISRLVAPEVPAEAEATLDPADWPAFRGLCHDMLDRALEHLEGVADKPVWQAPPEEAKRALAEALPLEAQGAERAAQDLLRWILPYGRRSAGTWRTAVSRSASLPRREA